MVRQFLELYQTKFAEKRINLRPVFYLYLQGNSFTIPSIYIQLFNTFSASFNPGHSEFIIELRAGWRKKTFFVGAIQPAKPTNRTNLGTSTRPNLLKLLLVLPFWLIQGTKTWTEFYNGLIPHKCVFDYDNPVIGPRLKNKALGRLSYVKCKHTGCDVVAAFNRNGTINQQLRYAVNGAGKK